MNRLLKSLFFITIIFSLLGCQNLIKDNEKTKDNQSKSFNPDLMEIIVGDIGYNQVSYELVGLTDDVVIKELSLYENETKIQTIDNNLNGIIGNLKRLTAYKILLLVEYQDLEGIDQVHETEAIFSTRDVIAPVVKLEVTELSNASISFDVELIDPDKVASFEQISVHSDDQLVMSFQSSHIRRVDDLLGSSTYSLSIRYKYISSYTFGIARYTYVTDTVTFETLPFDFDISTLSQEEYKDYIRYINTSHTLKNADYIPKIDFNIEKPTNLSSQLSKTPLLLLSMNYDNSFTTEEILEANGYSNFIKSIKRKNPLEDDNINLFALYNEMTAFGDNIKNRVDFALKDIRIYNQWVEYYGGMAKLSKSNGVSTLSIISNENAPDWYSTDFVQYNSRKVMYVINVSYNHLGQEVIEVSKNYDIMVKSAKDENGDMRYVKTYMQFIQGVYYEFHKLEIDQDEQYGFININDGKLEFYRTQLSHHVSTPTDWHGGRNQLHIELPSGFITLGNMYVDELTYGYQYNRSEIFIYDDHYHQLMMFEGPQSNKSDYLTSVYIDLSMLSGWDAAATKRVNPEDYKSVINALLINETLYETTHYDWWSSRGIEIIDHVYMNIAIGGSDTNITQALIIFNVLYQDNLLDIYDKVIEALEKLGLYYTDFDEDEFNTVSNQYRYYLANYELITNTKSYYGIERMMFENMEEILFIMEDRFDITKEAFTDRYDIYKPTSEELNIIHLLKENTPNSNIKGQMQVNQVGIDLSLIQIEGEGEQLFSDMTFKCIIGLSNGQKFIPLLEKEVISIDQTISCIDFNNIRFEDIMFLENGIYNLTYIVMTTGENPVNIIPLTIINMPDHMESSVEVDVNGFHITLQTLIEDSILMIRLEKEDYEAPFLNLKSGFISFNEELNLYHILGSQYETMKDLLDDLLVMDNHDSIININLTHIKRSDGYISVRLDDLIDSDYTYEIKLTDSTGNLRVYQITIETGE